MPGNVMSAAMVKTEPQELNNSLIQLLLQDEGDDFISLLLVRISEDSPPQVGQRETQEYIENLGKTAPSVFTVAFLDFVRTESGRIAAQCQSGNESKEQANSSPPTSLVLSENTNRGGELSTSRSSRIKTLPATGANVYDVEFPVLGVSNSNLPNHRHSKPRRVNPTPMESPVANSAFVFAKLEPNKQSNSNNSWNQSMAPLKFDMDALMKRCEKQKLKPKTSEEKISKQSYDTGTNEHPVLKDGAAHTGDINSTQILSVLQDKAAATGDLKTVQRSTVSSNTVSKLKRFATVHSKLVNERLVPSLVGELHYLFQLLSLGQSTRQQNKVHTINNKLFGCGHDCSLYACIVMELLGRVLDSVGEPLLSALVNHPMIDQHAPALMRQIKQSLARHQASTLHSFKSYEASDAQSTHPRVAAVGLPISLPFQEERDSRNHYKSRELQKLYNNRELCRDIFYAIIREAALFQNSFRLTLEDARSKVQESVRNLMNNLMIENYPWFTELFLEHLVQVAVCGETDPIVTGFARQDPIKLQKLHGRLTLGSVKSSRPSVFVTLANKGSNAGDSNGAVPPLKLRSHNCSDLAGMELMAMFPQALHVYIWIMEAADSYRLGVQIIGSLKSKICKLTEVPQHSRDSAEIGSVLTQRAVSLKALASLLGFLCFSPGVGSHSCGFGGESFSLDPPIDVEHVLMTAMENETLLLTLPWIIDYLQLIKGDQYAVRSPYFQRTFQALQNVYNYSILDPKSDSFGAPSMCILSLLDSFFESIDDLALDGSVRYSMVKPGKIQGLALDAKQGHGLDRLKGVVDASYIQQCCPTLMELRLLLTNSEEHLLTKKSASKLNIAKVKSLRKITPIHNPKGFQTFDHGSSFGPCEEALEVENNHIQMKLQQSFFKQHQELQRLVDFVVDTIAVNAALAASLRSVPPILEEALETLEATLARKGQASTGTEEEFQQEMKVEAEVETIITSCIHKALPLAIEDAKKHTAERTSEALALLANPDECPFVLGIAGKIAADSAALAASKKTLANISCEIRKKITQKLESCRRRFQHASKFNFKEERLKQQAPICNISDLASACHNFSLEDKENMENFCNIAQKDNISKQDITYEAFKGRTETVQLPCDHEISFLVDRALSCCAVVVKCCENPVNVDNQRYVLRVKLAGVATALDIMLTSKYGQMPPGGFDYLIYPELKSGSLWASLESSIVTSASSRDADAEIRFKIERGLAKRCVALAFHLCLLSPCDTFGYDSEVLRQCRCFTTVDIECKDAHSVFSIMKDACHELLKDEWSIVPGQAFGILIESSAAETNVGLARKTPKCASKDHFGGLMSGLLGMCVALENCGICESNFFLLEFFSAWRWNQALLSEPWKTSDMWFQALKHGVTSILIRCISGAQITPKKTESVFRCFEMFLAALCGSKSEESRSLLFLNEGKENVQNLRLVVIFIFLEMLELDCVHRPGISLAAFDFVKIINQIKTDFGNMQTVG